MKFHVNNIDYFKKSNWGWIKINFNMHKDYTPIYQQADIIIDKIDNKNDLINMNEKIKSLNKSVYYFICFRLNLDNEKHFLKLPIFFNPKIFFFAFDLRDHILSDDNISPLKGVTFPSSSKFYSSSNISENRYYFSFKGNCKQVGWFNCCNVRKHMKKICKINNSYYNYLYEDTSENHINKNKDLYMRILENSKFSLVLHGDGRWSHRLIEAMGSGSIPVLVSDGLTFPFEEIINYENSIVKIRENQIYSCKSVNDFINLLPDEIDAKLYKNNAKKIYDEYFATEALILNNLIKCMEIKIKEEHVSQKNSQVEEENYLNNCHLINKSYTWEKSTITFLENSEMKAFGQGKYYFIDTHQVNCNFGFRDHILEFNHDYSSFISVRKGDFEVVKGKLYKQI